MAAKRRARTLAFALLGAVAGTAVVCFARSSAILRAYHEWRVATGPERLFGTGTVTCLWTERNRIEVYDLRRGSAPVFTTTLTGIKGLSLMYWCHPADLKTPGRLEVSAHEGPDDSGQWKKLFALAVDVPSGATVDARHPDLYEAESGSNMILPEGDVFYFKGSGYHSESVSLENTSVVPPATLSDPIRVVIRPDMSSPLWNWPGHKVMLAHNGHYYISTEHPLSGIPAGGLNEDAKRNPPRDQTGGFSVSSSGGMLPESGQ